MKKAVASACLLLIAFSIYLLDHNWPGDVEARTQPEVNSKAEPSDVPRCGISHVGVVDHESCKALGNPSMKVVSPANNGEDQIDPSAVDASTQQLDLPMARESSLRSFNDYHACLSAPAGQDCNQVGASTIVSVEQTVKKSLEGYPDSLMEVATMIDMSLYQADDISHEYLSAILQAYPLKSEDELRDLSFDLAKRAASAGNVDAINHLRGLADKFDTYRRFAVSE